MERLTRLSFFIIGFIMAFDLVGVCGKSVLKRNKQSQIKSDLENISSDWENVGNSFYGGNKKDPSFPGFSCSEKPNM